MFSMGHRKTWAMARPRGATATGAAAPPLTNELNMRLGAGAQSNGAAAAAGVAAMAPPFNGINTRDGH